jgi:hypothetical protein
MAAAAELAGTQGTAGMAASFLGLLEEEPLALAAVVVVAPQGTLEIQLKGEAGWESWVKGQMVQQVVVPFHKPLEVEAQVAPVV